MPPPQNTAMHASRSDALGKGKGFETHDLRFQCLAQLPERPADDHSTISASSQNLMVNIQKL
ncbi:hypothetical protein A2U01_0015731 [Trifolium medium]|uniref:Uncharacterized protein n=1 Tax=Trifolium medium TaxID=97028 RepID=A0A392N4L7_9FABA|nr:hypothetical protein [Trifolium medium]